MADRRLSAGRAAHTASILALTGAMLWIGFVASSFTDFVFAQASRNVVVNGIYVGNVELAPLVGNRTMNVMFHPVNNDLNMINMFRLNWWQVANGQTVNDPLMDPINIGVNIGGVPAGDVNDPSYFRNDERSRNSGAGFNRQILFPNNSNWYIQDRPGLQN